MLAKLPNNPGAYALHLSLNRNCRLRVGKLGVFSFPAGDYFYLGSAHGPGGIGARLGRHSRSMDNNRPHWHIDYLRQIAEVSGYCFVLQTVKSPKPISLECVWSQELLKLPGISLPAPGFGSSDCHAGCPAHLVCLKQSGMGALLDINKTSWRQALAQAAGVPTTALQCH